MKLTAKITISFVISAFLVMALMVVIITTGIPFAIFFVAFPAIMAVVGYMVAKIITRAVHRLYRSAEIVKSGNLEYSLVEERKDEIGDLSRIFDDLVQEARKERTAAAAFNRENKDQKLSINELNEREEHFRNLFEHSNDAVFICDFDGKIIDVNKKACNMLERTKEELIDSLFWGLHTEEELTKSKRAFKIGEETCSVRFESKFKKKEKETIDVEISSSVVDFNKGVMQNIVCDITERKKLEKALRESEEKFRTFMETASDLMYITDKYGNFVY
ncbi:MAG: PAS domain S-box protein, partial [Candidatus Omnitrophica bacterium]|nr:PAS domain S-box protein [Candidatus Omnitrophota bacterium]